MSVCPPHVASLSSSVTLAPFLRVQRGPAGAARIKPVEREPQVGAEAAAKTRPIAAAAAHLCSSHAALRPLIPEPTTHTRCPGSSICGGSALSALSLLALMVIGGRESSPRVWGCVRQAHTGGALPSAC